MSAPDRPLEAHVNPEPELSLIGKWRWNILAALFAAMLLVALTLRHWRRGEVSEVSELGKLGEVIDVGGNRVGIRVVLSVVLVSVVLVGAFALFPLASDEASATSMAFDTAAVIEPVREVSNDLKCTQCGVVESTREIAQIPDRSVKGVEVTVRMKDGASHLFIAASSASSASPANSANPANWRAGERVIFIDGRSLSNE